MNVNRAAALARIRASEEGFAIRATEPGGAVNDGITMQTYRDYCSRHLQPAPTIDDLKNLDPLTIEEVYGEMVLEPVRFDDLPSGVDYAVADWAVNSGVAGALNALRRLFRTTLVLPEWRMDVALLKALSAVPAALAVSAICDARWALMQAAADFTTPSAVVPGKIIGDGRAFRMSSVRRGALEMLGFPPEPDHYTAPRLSP